MFQDFREVDFVRLSLIPLMIVGVVVVSRWKERRSGRLLMIMGVVHTLAGGFAGRRFLRRMVREGLLGEGDSGLGKVPIDVPKEMMFWFLILGPFIFMLGYVLSWMEGEGRQAPSAIGWQLLFTSLVAISLDPKGGFWFMLFPAIWLIRGSNRSRHEAT